MSKIKAKNLKKKETARDKRFVQTDIRLDPYHRNTSRIKCGPDGSVMETISTSNLYNYCSRDWAYWIEARILNSSKQQLLTLHFLLFSSSLKKRKRNRPLLTCGSWASCSLQSCILICFMPSSHLIHCYGELNRRLCWKRSPSTLELSSAWLYILQFNFWEESSE